MRILIVLLTTLLIPGEVGSQDRQARDSVANSRVQQRSAMFLVPQVNQQDTVYVKVTNAPTANGRDWFDILTAIVAVSGLGLAMFSIYSQWRDNQSHIVVKTKLGLVSSPTGVVPCLTLSAENHGKAQVVLNQPSLEVERAFHTVFTRFFHSEVTFPYTLPPGDSCSVLIEINQIARILRAGNLAGVVEAQGLFEDRLGHKFVSKTMKIDISAWERNLFSV